MTVIRRFTYDNPLITALIEDEIGYYAWLGFAEEDGECLIKKVWGGSPDQIFFELSREVESINAFAIDTTQLYVAYTDDELLGEILTQSNPVSGNTEIEIPSGVTQFPVDVKVNGTDLFFLLPGSDSGTNAQILVYDTDGDYQETIDLSNSSDTVVDAISFDIDADDNLWVATNTSPATVVRVWQESSGDWFFEVTEIV